MSRRKEVSKEDLKERVCESVAEGDSSTLSNLLSQASPQQRKAWLVPFSDRNTLVHLACQKGHTRVLRTLVQIYGDDIVNRTNRSRQTPLHSACENGFTRMVKALIEEYGCSTSAVDSNGDTPLHAAAKHGAKDLAKYLVQKGSPVNQTNKQKETALHISMERSNVDFSKELIHLGAQTNIKNHENKTAVDVSFENGTSSRFNFPKSDFVERRQEKGKRDSEKGETSKENKHKVIESKNKTLDQEERKQGRKRKGKERAVEEEIEFCPDSEVEEMFHKKFKQMYTPFSDPIGFGNVFHRISQDLDSEAIEWEQEPMFTRVDAIHVRYER